MNGKRWICLGLIGILCMASLTVLAADSEFFVRGEGDGEMLRCVAGDGESYYALTVEGEIQRIYRVASEDEEPTLLYEQPTGLLQAGEDGAEEAVHLLVGGEDRVYVLNAYAKRLGTVDDSGVTWAETSLSLPNLAGEIFDVSEIALACHSNGLLYLGVRGENHACRLAVVEMETGMLVGDYNMEDAARIAPYKDGKFVVYRDAALYAVAPGDWSAELLAEGINAPSGLCYDERGDAVYYAADGYVWRLMNGRQPEPVTAIEGGQPDGVLAGIFQNGVYTLAHARWLQLYKIGGAGESTGGEERPILVAVDWLPPAAEVFAAENPGIPVDKVELYHDTDEDIIAAIENGVDSPDIYSISVEGAGYRRLRQDGYMGSLSGNQAIAGAVDGMYPAISRLLYNEAGQVVAIPANIAVTGWSVNMTLWEREFPGQALPRTWDAWLTLLEAWEASHDPEEATAFFRSADIRQELFFQAYQQFVMLSERTGQGVDFSDPALRAVLTRIEALPGEPMDPEAPGEQTSGPSIFSSDNMVLFEEPDAPAEAWEGGEEQRYASYLIPVFTEDQDPLVPMRLEVFFLNPNAANPEAATALLETLLIHGDAFLRYALMPTLNDPVPNANYETDLQELHSYLAQLEEALPTIPAENRAQLELAIAEQQRFIAYYEQTGHWQLSEGAIRSYREEIGPYLYSNADSLFLGDDGENSAQDQLNDILGGYLDGQLSLDEMLQALSSQAGIME